MATKPNAQEVILKEQIIEDLVTGLKFQFVCKPETSAPYRMIIYGASMQPREIIFDPNGEEAGSGTSFVGQCQPSWIKAV